MGLLLKLSVVRRITVGKDNVTRLGVQAHAMCWRNGVSAPGECTDSQAARCWASPR